MLPVRQHLFISLASAHRYLSVDGTQSKIGQICGAPKSYSQVKFNSLIFCLMLEIPLNSCIIMPEI